MDTIPGALYNSNNSRTPYSFQAPPNITRTTSRIATTALTDSSASSSSALMPRYPTSAANCRQYLARHNSADIIHISLQKAKDALISALPISLTSNFSLSIPQLQSHSPKAESRQRSRRFRQTDRIPGTSYLFLQRINTHIFPLVYAIIPAPMSLYF